MTTSVAAAKPDGVAIIQDGHVVRLKWHRLKRRAGDTPFSPAQLAEAMALGASCEIDIRLHGEGGFVVMHDATLDRETTGSGPVEAATAAAIGRLQMRDVNGTPTGAPVLLLEDVVSLAAQDAAPGTEIQLDLKAPADTITPAIARRFADLVRPLADRFVLSSLDFDAVQRLAAGFPELAIGFDPCASGIADRLVERSAFDAFVGETLVVAPDATMIYLDYRLILQAATLGYDVVAAFHRADRAIDAYTLNTTHPNATGILRTLVALKVDQITTDEPIALEQRFVAA